MSHTGAMQDIKVTNILIQTMVKVAQANIAQCIPHKCPMEHESMFKKIHFNQEFAFKMDSIGLNINLWLIAPIKYYLCNC